MTLPPKTLESVSKNGKVSRYKPKLLAFLYANNELSKNNSEKLNTKSTYKINWKLIY